jgi:hypothetical protein
MNNIYIMTPTGLRETKYEPKRFWHLHWVDVFFLCGISALIGVICYGIFCAYYFPVPKCPNEHIKIVRMK